jgi:hypothetical protein
MRRALANSLFEYLVYDLDAQQIVNFKLKPWAELLMQLKLTLDDTTDSGDQSDGKQTVLWCPYGVTGARDGSAQERLGCATQRVLERLYPLGDQPEVSPTIAQRNALIRARRAAGETLRAIAAAVGLSVQRVHQIARGLS